MKVYKDSGFLNIFTPKQMQGEDFACICGKKEVLLVELFDFEQLPTLENVCPLGVFTQ